MNCHRTHRVKNLPVPADPFRCKRFCYILKEGTTVFGPKGDCQPPNFSVRKEHCTVERAGNEVSITPGKGDSFVNGKFLEAKTKLEKVVKYCVKSNVLN